MTYSHNTSENPLPFTPNPTSKDAAHKDRAHSAKITPAKIKSVKMWAAVAAGMMWMFQIILRQHSEGGARRVQRSRRFRAMLLVMSILLSLIPGTRAEKSARLRQIFAKANARMAALRREYIIWRQRKCWMWGGGFMNGALASLTDNVGGLFARAGDLQSFDALIPD